MLSLMLWVAMAFGGSIPVDFAHFLDRREQCIHWSNEEPYDSDRELEIKAVMDKLRCNHLDEDEQHLRSLYKNVPEAMKAFDADEGISQ